MNDDFEGAVRFAGKSGAIQAFAMVETVTNIFMRFGGDPNGAAHLHQRRGVFADGWTACAAALADLAGTMRRHAEEAMVVAGEAEGELVHMRPEQMHQDIVRVLEEHLFNKADGAAG